MGFTIAQGLMLVLPITSIIVVSIALPYGNCNDTHTSNKIMVGDHHHSIYGFNYTKWAFKHGPFYLYDTLGELDYFAVAACYILPYIELLVVKYNDQNHILNRFCFYNKL